MENELAHTRHLIIAADEIAAKEKLLALGEKIEDGQRDDQLLEIFAQLAELYLVRTAYQGTEEGLRRMREIMARYSASRAGTRSDVDVQGTIASVDIDRMILRYSRRAQFLETGLAAAHGDHESAEAALLVLTDDTVAAPDLADEHAYLVTYARILCAVALCDDDLHVRSVPLWEKVIDALDRPDTGSEFDDHLLVIGGTGYGRFCIETGRLSEAEPWLRRAGAQGRGARVGIGHLQDSAGAGHGVLARRVTAQKPNAWSTRPIQRSPRAGARTTCRRCWLYLGLIAMSIGELDDADERFGHAERHWREIEKPLHIHRILLQRSWVDIFRGDFDAARARTNEARELLDSWPRHSWLQYARLDDHLGSIWRADALADPQHAKDKLERAVELKVPAALAVDSVRHSIADADARMRWATYVSARILAGAFAVAWESENTELVSELVEYHSARGTFSAEPDREAAKRGPAPRRSRCPSRPSKSTRWSRRESRRRVVVPHSPRLGPLPPLQMDPTTAPIMTRYRELAFDRYGRDVTADGAAWSTWP